MRKNFLLLAGCALGAFAACSKVTPPAEPETKLANAATSSPANQPPGMPIDACSLLTSAEIQAVQGEAVKETKTDRKSEEGFTISQCYFMLPTFSNSINLRLVQRGSEPDGRNPRDVWKETFARDLENAVQKRKKGPPERVSNLGDEAFWMGGPTAGALYVLKDNHYIRIAVGGEANQPIKIEKATRLAQLILPRL
jgi:hypothetical protein